MRISDWSSDVCSSDLCEAADDDAEQAAADAAGDDRDDRWHSDLRHEEGRDVGAAPEECGMAEGEDAGKSEQQVVRTREQCEAQDLRQNDGVKLEGGEADAGKSSEKGRVGEEGVGTGR